VVVHGAITNHSYFSGDPFVNQVTSVFKEKIFYGGYEQQPLRSVIIILCC